MRENPKWNRGIPSKEELTMFVHMMKRHEVLLVVLLMVLMLAVVRAVLIVGGSEALPVLTAPLNCRGILYEV